MVLDEAYTDLLDLKNSGLFQFIKKYSNLIISHSLSKAYGPAGLRIGYAVSNPEIADLLNRSSTAI